MKYLSLSIPRYGGITPPAGIPTGGISDADGLQGIINLVIGLLFAFGIIAALAMIIFAGIQWIASGGDKGKIDNAKGRLTWAIIGLVVLICSFLIVRTVITILGGNVDFFLKFK